MLIKCNHFLLLCWLNDNLEIMGITLCVLFGQVFLFNVRLCRTVLYFKHVCLMIIGMQI